MRRLAVLATLALAAAAAVVVGVGCGGADDGGYRVRAMFTNAFTVIPGEDVKVAGVKVGRISALKLQGTQAAVVLDIQDKGFQDFRNDASCTIRPQSLIGERFVECTPTEPKASGARQAPALRKVQDGPGKDEYLLPAKNNVVPIDLDLVANTYTLPVRQRLSIIINELGTGLAANGSALKSAVRNADPALRETDKVLAILAEQNKTLAQLAENGDKVLAPLARDRRQVADFVDKANTTAQATADRRGDLESSIQKLPAFLQQLTPTMQRLGELTDQLTPVVSDLGASSSDINTFVKGLGATAKAGTPAIKELGDATVSGRSALLASKPIVSDLASFSSDARPLVKNVGDLLQSVQDTGGVERLMDFLFFSVASSNGFDADGHYLRAQALVNTCLTYVITAPSSACSANFAAPAGSDAASDSDATTAQVKARNTDGSSAAKTAAGAKAAGTPAKIAMPAALLPGKKAATPTATTKQVSTSVTRDDGSATSDASDDADTTLLDYLMGN